MIITPSPPLVNIGSHKHMRYLFQHRILNLYHHLPIPDTANTPPLVCLLAVVVLPLGPLLGPKLLLLLIDCSPFFLTPLSS